MLFRRRNSGPPSKTRGASRQVRITQAAIPLLAMLSLACSSLAFAANPDVETVLKASRQRIETLDYRVTGRLTRVDGSGKRTTYKFAAKAHWFPDGLKLLAEITGTDSQKTTLLAHLTAAGRVTIEAILPGEKTASALPFDRWNDPLVGTDFSYEDMVESQFFWKSQELLPSAKYGARDCLVLKSTPSPQDRSHYDSVTSWIDSGILIPVQVVKTLRGTAQQKEFVYFGLRQTNGVWSAAQVEAKLPGKPGSSLLVIEAGSPKANLGAKDFVLSSSATSAEKAP
jgi:hypothetical protein